MSAKLEVLASWNEGAARRAILEFVERTVSLGVPVEERVAVFDNDGTLWCEKPMPIQADAPMVELLRYLEADGSATTFEYTSNDHGGTITHKAEADYLDDGPQKPIRIWSRTGRRPVLAAGNSNGDIPMLEFTHHDDKPHLNLLVLHDDPQREFDYTGGAEQALKKAGNSDWTIISIKNDWGTVF